MRLILIALLIIFQNNINICNAELQYRLDRYVFPESYDIKIKPYLLDKDGSKQFTFDGDVNITIYAVQPDVKNITLHKEDIDIYQAELYEADSEKNLEEFNTTDFKFEKSTEVLTIYLKEILTIDKKYKLHFLYTGQIRNGTAGFFRANYIDPSGETKWTALTQAQRISARAILPCWDEPAFKAKFRMTISRPKEYNSVFNTRLIYSKIDDYDSNRYIDVFEWTPTMSSYLIAFMVSQYVKRGDSELVVLSRSEHYDYTEFAYDVAKRTLEAYNNYTKLPYKELGNDILQMSSSPKFPHNGMENWGLVLYQDNVLVREPSDGWKDKQYTISILVHETAHMWFGNSVTFSWWSFFWLNEGFARYYQFFLAHELYPEYQLDQQFIIRQIHTIFGTDALNTTLPLSTPEQFVQTPTEIEKMFSGIAYAKGATIIRMFRNVMGHKNFDLAIHEYLKEFHLKNTMPSDLFKHLKQHWPKEQQVNLDQFFYDWTEQVGFPVLFVNVTRNGQQVILKQRRFLLSPDDGSDPNLRYTIPLTFTTDLDKNFEDLTPKAFFNGESWSLESEQHIKWIIFNIQQSNYHRVFYDTETLKNIFKDLAKPEYSGIHTINRAQLIDDIFNFAYVGMMDYADVFQLLEYLVDESFFLPWQAAFSGFSRISQRLDVEQQVHFRNYINRITSSLYKNVSLSRHDDIVLSVYKRSSTIYWACKYGNPDCNDEARAMLLNAYNTNKLLPSDIRETVYCSAVRFGGFQSYNILDQLYQKENRTSEKELLMRSLGCTFDFMQYHFARILSDDIPQNFKILTLKSLYEENPDHVPTILEMIFKTYNELAPQLGGYSALADIINDLCNYITTHNDFHLLKHFIHENGMEFGKSFTTLQKGRQTVEKNLLWAKKRLGRLALYLENSNSAALSSFSLPLLVLSTIYVNFLI